MKNKYETLILILFATVILPVCVFLGLYSRALELKLLQFLGWI